MTFIPVSLPNIKHEIVFIIALRYSQFSHKGVVGISLLFKEDQTHMGKKTMNPYNTLNKYIF